MSQECGSSRSCRGAQGCQILHLGFVVRMCLVCIISACAWRLGTVRSMRVGTGCKRLRKSLGCFCLEMRTLFVPGSTCSRGHSHKASQEPQTAQEPDTWTASRQDPQPFSPPASLPRLPVTSPWPELDGARRVPAGCLPHFTACCCLRSSVSLLPSPRPSDVVPHLAVTEMGRIFIEAAERGERSSDREDQQRRGARRGYIPF